MLKLGVFVETIKKQYTVDDKGNEVLSWNLYTVDKYDTWTTPASIIKVHIESQGFKAEDFYKSLVTGTNKNFIKNLKLDPIDKNTTRKIMFMIFYS